MTEQVHAEVVRQLGERLNAPHAVAPGVEGCAVDADAELSRQDGDDAATDPALGGQAHPDHPFARVVVHAAAGHHRQRVAGGEFADHPIAGDRVGAAVGQGGPHHGEVLDAHLQRALLEVDLHRVGDRPVESAGRQRQVTERPVAVAGGGLRRQHRLVEFEVPPGEGRHRLTHSPHLTIDVDAWDHRADHDRPGVDHRVVRSTGVGLEADGVERLAAGLEADVPGDLLQPQLVDHHRVDERLGDRLDRERVLVARPVAAAEHAGHGDAEAVGVDVGELGDVVGQPTAVLPAGPNQQVGQTGADVVGAAGRVWAGWVGCGPDGRRRVGRRRRRHGGDPTGARRAIRLHQQRRATTRPAGPGAPRRRHASRVRPGS